MTDETLTPGLPRPESASRDGSGETRIDAGHGLTLCVRPIRPSDAPLLQRFHDHLSRRSIYFRFFGALPHLSDQQARHFAEVDYHDRFALVAYEPDRPEDLIGVARFDRGPAPDEGELAIVLADRCQGRGLGRTMLLLLVEAARERGIRRLFGLVLPDNDRVIRLLRHLGFPYQEHWEGDHERITLAL
ncbi:MAG TPA: GNAT family N-acetyltransferase [Dehalococcoidia bacterium]|nr:GNAT family N-acetyltransferase [Dehalococcoidia bacterium]